MKTHLMEEDVFDMAFDKLNLANPKEDKLHEIAKLMDLEFDEEKGMYHNPDCCNCGKKLDKRDVQFGKKSHPYLCVTCFTNNG